MHDDLTTAIRYHQQGQLEQAARIYQGILARQADHPDALCLAFHETRRPVRTASVGQVRQPIYRRSVGRWKHYEQALGELFAKL